MSNKVKKVKKESKERKNVIPIKATKTIREILNIYELPDFINFYRIDNIKIENDPFVLFFCIIKNLLRYGYGMGGLTYEYTPDPNNFF